MVRGGAGLGTRKHRTSGVAGTGSHTKLYTAMITNRQKRKKDQPKNMVEARKIATIWRD